MSPAIRHNYKYIHSTVQRAKGRRQKFHFCRLTEDHVTSSSISPIKGVIFFWKLGVVHGPGARGGPWTRCMGWSMDRVHGGGPWTGSMFCIRPTLKPHSCTYQLKSRPPPPRAKVRIWLDIVTNLNKPPPYWGILTGKTPTLVGKLMLFPDLTFSSKFLLL